MQIRLVFQFRNPELTKIARCIELIGQSDAKFIAPRVDAQISGIQNFDGRRFTLKPDCTRIFNLNIAVIADDSSIGQVVYHGVSKA